MDELTSTITKRPTVLAMEKILGQRLNVLDHGFIRLIDYMGDDGAIVQAARVSYGKGTTQVNADKALIAYLMRHSHTTPFEMCEIKLHIKAPIFVARQWLRHRSASVNEYSARYSILDREFYIPDSNYISPQSQENKQCRVAESNLSPLEAQMVLDILREDATRCYDNYMKLMNIDEKSGGKINPEHDGLARELARMNLTLNYYTQWYWKIDLHNLLHFLRLRAHSHAQYEIRVYAEKILDMVCDWLPHTYEAFKNYKLEGENFSGKAISVIQKLIKGEKIEREVSGLSKREWNDMCTVLKIENLLEE